MNELLGKLKHWLLNKYGTLKTRKKTLLVNHPKALDLNQVGTIFFAANQKIMDCTKNSAIKT